MYPFGSLPENLAAFCDRLRRGHGFRIGPAELQDAARALAMTTIGDERRVRDTLRPILSSSADDVEKFDGLFRAFFFPVAQRFSAAGITATGEHRLDERRDLPPSSGIRADRVASATRVDPDDHKAPPDAGGRAATVLDTSAVDAARAAGLLRASYSPAAGEEAAPDLVQAAPPWRYAATMLVRRLHAGLSRRWRPAVRGQRFDFRRTLRTSLHTGGETVIPRWRARPRRRPRFVVLIDGSRSMGAYARTALQLAVALAEVARDVEVFTFSTSIERVTRDLRRAAAGERRLLRHLHEAWGGGTTIGACLRGFLRGAGGRLLGRDVFVIVASDGLDVGEPDVLRGAMTQLQRRSAGVIWLNPLIETPGYEPTAAGMRVARPFVSTFACVNDAAGLVRLARMARVRS